MHTDYSEVYMFYDFILVFFGRPLERLSVTWKRNGIKITSGISSFGRRLTITNPTSADVGMYFCEAKLRESTEEPARAKAFLSILGNSPGNVFFSKKGSGLRYNRK